MSLTSDQIGGIARALLTTLAGIAVTKGWVDQNTAVTIVGGVVTVFVAAWSWYTNRPQKIVVTPGGIGAKAGGN